MTNGTTLTVRLSQQTQSQLAKLAAYTDRDPRLLGAEAISDFVHQQLASIESIESGRADIRAGRSTTHEDVSHEVRTIIDRARAGM